MTFIKSHPEKRMMILMIILNHMMILLKKKTQIKSLLIWIFFFKRIIICIQKIRCFPNVFFWVDKGSGNLFWCHINTHLHWVFDYLNKFLRHGFRSVRFGCLGSTIGIDSLLVSKTILSPTKQDQMFNTLLPLVNINLIERRNNRNLTLVIKIKNN